MREVIATGKTVEEATEAGCRELGLGRHEVSVEILEMPVKKFFKTTPAKVKVTADGLGEAPAEQPAQVARPARPEPEARPARQVQPAARAEKQSAEPGQLLPAEPEEAIDLSQNPLAQKAADYLSDIFAALGVSPLKLTVSRQGDATLLRIENEDVASKIDIRGETIQALSYLIDRAVNAGVDKKAPGYLRVRLDIAGYRDRREGELVALASRTAKEVARTGRSHTLAPMNPYERLIVHTAVSKIEGVVSESIGSDVERRVVVKSTAPTATAGDDWKPPRKGGSGSHSQGGHSRSSGGSRGGHDRNRSRDRAGYGGGGRGPRPERTSSTPEREYADVPRDPGAQPVVPKRRDAIRDGEDLPLYGKIEL